MAASKKPVMDVAKPGKSPADATTRPIITGHAIMKDPMVNEGVAVTEGVTEEETTPEVTEEKISVPSSSHKVIQPLENKEEKSEEPAEKPAEEPGKPEPTNEEAKETPVSDDAVVDAVLDQVSDKKEETKQSEEDRKRQEIVAKLTEEKKYFVPIAQESKRRKNKLTLLILSALLSVVVGLGLAADAGVIDPGFKVPFDFIKDKPVATTTTQVPVTTQPKANTNPLIVIDASADTTTKDYMDTAEVYSLKYPSNWTTKLSEGGCDKC